MKTLVNYDSVYGNTRTIAQTIADNLSGEVQLLHVSQVNPVEISLVDLLIIGSPTHGALATEPIQALIERIGAPDHIGTRVATFDTRLTWGFLDR